MSIKTIAARAGSGSDLYYRRSYFLLCCSKVIHEYFGALRPYTKYEVCISASPPKEDRNYLTITLETQSPVSGLPNVYVEGTKYMILFSQFEMLIKLCQKWQCNTVYAWLYEVIDEGDV